MHVMIHPHNILVLFTCLPNLLLFNVGLNNPDFLPFVPAKSLIGPMSVINLLV